MYEYYYGTVKVDNIKSNNWKKLHNIPIKSKCKVGTIYGDPIGAVVVLSLNKYVSKRSLKKKKKQKFRYSWNILKAIALQNRPDLQRLYHRYGYSSKKLKRKIRRLKR